MTTPYGPRRTGGVRTTQLATGRQMTETRTIKKYPNRRLYDTEESRYITLADVREDLVRFVVGVVLLPGFRLSKLGELNADAVRLMDRAGWK